VTEPETTAMDESAGRRWVPGMKSLSGIAGLDAMTRGGIPRGRVTLIEGGPGAGKTVLALQSMVHAAQDLGEACIFVAFEEPIEQIQANASTFGWDFSAPSMQRLFFLEVRPDPASIQSGGFDLGGLLAALDAKIEQTHARRVTFDAIDVLLEMLDDPAAERRELYRLRDWILARQLTTIITSKIGAEGLNARSRHFLQFLADCAITLHHDVKSGISQRGIRILKYRGSEFHENQAPYVIGSHGMEVSWIMGVEAQPPVVTEERISTGVERLDAMLDGGFHRGAGILVTGSPGTAKTTLAGAFAEAACLRGERTLFVSFDSHHDEVVRNLGSVGIHLERHLTRGRRPGLLSFVFARALEGSAETHLLEIQAQARRHGARCVVIDPVSALADGWNKRLGQSIARRLIDWSKSQGITLFCTSLLDETSRDLEGSAIQISTIADTWVHLSYVVRAGERNRCLTIVKSRGTAHSNQVRELVLSQGGVTLADAYTAGGEPLLGTLRWEHENAEIAAERAAERTEVLEHHKLASEQAVLHAQLVALQKQLEAKQVEAKVGAEVAAARRAAIREERNERRSRRGADREVIPRSEVGSS
jgi:circadian clock protein KaiC